MPIARRGEGFGVPGVRVDGIDIDAATLNIAREEGVPVIDVYAAFRDRPALFDDESHFGVEGHRLAAELVFEAALPDGVAAVRQDPQLGTADAVRVGMSRVPAGARHVIVTSGDVPLLATQILWINLITDSGPALAMGIDAQTDDPDQDFVCPFASGDGEVKGGAGGEFPASGFDAFVRQVARIWEGDEGEVSRDLPIVHQPVQRLRVRGQARRQTGLQRR